MNTQRIETPPVDVKKKPVSYFFWVTIVGLAIISLGLAVIGSYRAMNSSGTGTYDIPQTTLETIFSETAERARVIVAPDVESLLSTVYAPAYAAVPRYADFHFSVLGEYTELTEAARGQMSASLYEKLFAGYQDRLSDAARSLDQRFSEAYAQELKNKVQLQVPSENLSLPLGDMTQVALQDALERAKITFPLATVAAGVASSGSLKAVSAIMAKKMAAKIGAKAAAKGVAKGGGIMAGAGGGALLCSWSGPGAAVCGVVGGATAWFLADAVIVNIDEYYNRGEFEAELRAMIDEDKATKKKLLEAALRDKAFEMDKASKAMLEDFTLDDLSKN